MGETVNKRIYTTPRVVSEPIKIGVFGSYGDVLKIKKRKKHHRRWR